MNQGKMLLQIAAAYGQPLETERIKELAAVVAGGFLFKALAGELVGLIPGFGWALKGGIAYSGTMVMGSAAIAYFEEGADLSGVVHALTEKAGEAVARVKQLRSRSGDDSFGMDEPLTLAAAHAEAVSDATDAAAQPKLLEVPPVTPTLLPPHDTAPAGPTDPFL
jgi:uncharacterized protein (DUF697 family)